MKKLLLIIASILIFCSCNLQEEPLLEEPQSEPEIHESSEEKENFDEVPAVSLAEDIEFWGKYSEIYDVCICGWASDDYFFIILKNKEGENFRYLFWEAENEKLVDLGEHETELFLANHTFSRNGKFYMISAPDKIMEIELGSFEISYIDINISEEYIEKEFERTVSLSPSGTVAEFKDKFTLLIYDIFDPKQKKTIDLKEAAPLGIILNQSINWSFDGKYFSVFVYEEGKEYHQDSTYAIFNSQGEFVRKVTGGDRETWDNDRVWTWSYNDENKENYYIYSLSEPDFEPTKVFRYSSPLNQLRPRNGIYYYQKTNADKTECEIIMADSLKGVAEPIAKFDIGGFGWIPQPSPNGKYLACIEKNPENFFFKFIKLEENSSLPEVSESSEQEEIPEEKPAFEFEKPEILYPENVPEELFESAAFKKAMERPSVILYDYEPISDCLAAVNFVEGTEKGEYSELYIFNFHDINQYENKSAYCIKFVSQNGTVTKTYEDWPDWENRVQSEYHYIVTKAYINDYGYFTAESDIYEPIYYKVISDFALYENAAEHLALKEKYIDPIFTITASPEEFESPSDFSGRTLLWLFEDIYNYENGHSPWQEFGNNWPVSEMLSLLNRYFEGVTKEMLLHDMPADYDPKTDTVYYEGGRGGVPPERMVFDFEQKGDILTLYYHLYNEESGTIYNDRYYVLKIKLLSDGSFRYLSQKIMIKEE